MAASKTASKTASTSIHITMMEIGIVNSIIKCSRRTDTAYTTITVRPIPSTTLMMGRMNYCLRTYQRSTGLGHPPSSPMHTSHSLLARTNMMMDQIRRRGPRLYSMEIRISSKILYPTSSCHNYNNNINMKDIRQNY